MEHEEGPASVHVEATVEVVVHAGKVDKEHATGLQDANRVIQRSLNVIDEMHAELVDEAVVGVGRNVVSSAQVSNHRHVLAVPCEIECVRFGNRVCTVVAGRLCRSHFEAFAADVGSTRFQKALPVVANNRLAGQQAIRQWIEPSELKTPKPADEGKPKDLMIEGAGAAVLITKGAADAKRQHSANGVERPNSQHAVGFRPIGTFTSGSGNSTTQRGVMSLSTALARIERSTARVWRGLGRTHDILSRRRGIILLYHRIAELESDPQLLAVTPRHFAEHLAVLRDFADAVPLAELLSANTVRGSRRPAFAVTFDDGYADNLYNAKPILDRFDVPGTVFVTTSYIGSDREFWWDDLERLLLLPGRLPETLGLTIGPTTHQWDINGAALYTEDDYQQHRVWCVETPGNPTTRHHAYRQLCELLKSVPSEAREAALDVLSGLAGATRVGRQTHRALSENELVRMVDGTRLEVAAHSVTHTALAGLIPAEQRAEIHGSKARLQEITGLPVNGFAYPFGGRHDYSPATVDIVRDAGFLVACSNRPTPVRRRSDPLQLPRLLVRDWDGDAFGRQLQACLAR